MKNAAQIKPGQVWLVCGQKLTVQTVDSNGVHWESRARMQPSAIAYVLNECRLIEQ